MDSPDLYKYRCSKCGNNYGLYVWTIKKNELDYGTMPVIRCYYCHAPDLIEMNPAYTCHPYDREKDDDILDNLFRKK